MTSNDELRQAIENSDPESVESVLRADPDAANRPIRWGKYRKNLSDPLHYVCDCCFNGVLTNGTEAAIMQHLLAFGAELDGNEDRESPLIGAASLGVADCAELLIRAGANVHLTSVFGANALHWASFMGMPTTVSLLLEQGAELETRCSEFDSTPLFWAVQGFSRYGPKEKTDQLGAAGVLLRAGADAGTRNLEGTAAVERAGEADSMSMKNLIEAYLPV